jgi:hypothetical protein
MTNPPDPAGSGKLAMSHLGVRKGIGFLGLALPIVLILGKLLLGGGGMQGSISSYYYTVMRDYFVGTTCAMAVFFVAYRYRRQDNYLSNALALFSAGIALFPTTRAGVRSTTGQAVAGNIHLACATLFFLCLAYFSFFVFTRSDPQLRPTPQKRRRNVVYRVCGVAIVGCLALVVVTDLSFTEQVKDVLHPLFWLESIAVWAFSVSWLIKGEFLFLKDQPAH